MNKKKMLSKLKMGIILLSIASCTEINPNEDGALVPKTVDQDLTLPSITVNGTSLHSEAYGFNTNPIVIFLHGGPGADYRNALNVKQLSENGYFVVFYDQRGAGLSQRQKASDFSIQQCLDDLTSVIEYYKTSPNQKVFLFGHSWGAILASAYINKFPSKISGAVLVEPGGLTWDEISDYIIDSKKMELFSETSNDALYLDQFITGSQNQHQILDYKAAVVSCFSYAANNKEGIEGSSPFWRYGAVAFNSLVDIAKNDGFDFTSNLNQYNKKVLILYSENNSAYGLPRAQKIASYFQNNQIELINGTGHEMIYFKWESVFPLVLNYLNSL